jgi:hypothetical protein
MADAIWNNRFILADPGKNETVLWENNRAWVGTDVAPEVNSGTLSEAITNFKTIKIYFARTNATSLHYNSVSEMESSDISSQGGFFISTPVLQSSSKNLFLACTFISVSGTTFTESIGTQWSQPTGTADSSKIFLHPYKIVGINRISGGN